MPEIKTPLRRLEPGEYFIDSDVCYVITPDHTLADIVRHLLTETDHDEIAYLLAAEPHNRPEGTP